MSKLNMKLFKKPPSKTPLLNLALSFMSLGLLIGALEFTFYQSGELPLLKDPQVNEWDPDSFKLNLCESDPDAPQRECQIESLSEKTDGPLSNSILAFGGSSLVWSAKEGEDSFIDLLNKKLDLGNSRLEVINMGSACKDSYFIRSCFNLVKAVDPAYVLIYSGHNDVINIGYLNTKRRIWMKENPFILSTIKFLQNHSYSFSFISSILPQGINSENRLAKINRQQIQERQQQITDGFEKNVKQVVKESTRSGTQVILVTTISNHHDIPPQKYFDLSEQEVGPVGEKAHQFYHAGQTSFEKGQYDQSLKQLIQAKELDIQGSRALAGMNEVLRNIAKQNSSVTLIDLESYFYKQFRKEGLGCNLFGNELYCDHMHPNLRAKKIMAKVLSQAIIEID